MRLRPGTIKYLEYINRVCIVVVFTIVISIFALLPFKLKQEAHLHFKTYNSLILGNEYAHLWKIVFIILMDGEGREE